MVRKFADCYHQLYAIDHEKCFRFGSNAPLKLRYIDHLSGYSFKTEVKHLFSPEAIEKYKKVIQIFGIANMDQVNKWMDFIVPLLENPGEQPLDKLAESAIAEYRQRFQSFD